MDKTSSDAFNQHLMYAFSRLNTHRKFKLLRLTLVIAANRYIATLQKLKGGRATTVEHMNRPESQVLMSEHGLFSHIVVPRGALSKSTCKWLPQASLDGMSRTFALASKSVTKSKQDCFTRLVSNA